MPRKYKRKITPKRMREKMEELDILYSQVQRAVGIPKPWFNRMITDNRHCFVDPDPVRMKLIWRWLKGYERFKAKQHKVLFGGEDE